MADDVGSRLGRLDACAISDALDQLRLQPAVTGIRPLAARQRIFGRVITVRLAAGPAPAGAPMRHLCTAAIDRAERGDVIVVEQGTGVECAGWGGILSNAALLKGVSGAIIEGPARDIDEAIEIGFPIHARSATARTARGRIHEAESGGIIKVGAASVSDGDYVVADSSGVTFIPALRISDVLEAAENISAREAAMARSVHDGVAVSTVMGARYENLLATGKQA